MTETVIIQLITSVTTLGIAITTLIGIIYQRKVTKRITKRLDALVGPLANHSDKENTDRRYL